MYNHQTLDTSFQTTTSAHSLSLSSFENQAVKPTILIIGANDETRLLYKFFLELWDFKIVEANCFEELPVILEILRPELILMDGNLSFEDDLETIRKIRGHKSLRNAPLILTSGHSQTRIRSLALSCGVNSFLIKPVNFDELQNKLQRHIENFCQSNHIGGIV